MPKSPERGSTAEVGNDSEGIYESRGGVAFVGPHGRLFAKEPTRWTFGSIAVTGHKWSFNYPSIVRSQTGVNEVKGSGSVVPKSSMFGTVTVGDDKLSDVWGLWKYSPSNSLAITQSGIAGKWSVNADGFDMSITLDERGMFSGTTGGSAAGVCAITGEFIQAEPGTSKNMFNIQLKAADAAKGGEQACLLSTDRTYYGMSAIVLTAAGTYESNGYYRSLVFHAANDEAAALTNVLRKQP